MPQLITIITFYMILALSISHETLFAQAKDRAKPNEEVLRYKDMLDGRIVELVSNSLEPFLGKDRFYILANVVVTAAPTDIPYDPGSYRSSLTSISYLEIVQKIESLEILVTISDEVADTTMTSLRLLVESRFGGGGLGKVSIKFSKASLVVPPRDLSLIENLRQAKATIDDLESKKEQLEKELNDTLSELNQKDQSSVKMQDDLKKLEQDLQDAKDQSKNEELFQKKVGLVAGEIKPLVLMMLGVIFLSIILFAIAPAKILSTSIKNIGAGFGEIGAAIKSVGESIGTALGSMRGGASGEDEAPKEEKTSIAAGPAVADGQSSGGGAQEFHYRHILVLIEELNTLVDSDAADFLVEYLNSMLDHSLDLAMASLEIIGKENANLIFEALPNEKKELVRNFMRGNGYSRKSRVEWLIQAGESLKSVLAMKAWLKPNFQRQKELSQVLLKIKPTDVRSLFGKLDTEEMARLFQYYDSQKLAEIINEMSDPEAIAKIGPALAQMPKVRADASIDNRIAAKIGEIMQVQQSNEYLPHMNYYEKMLGQVTEDIAEQLSEPLSKADPTLRRLVDEKVVSLTLLTQIDGASLQQVVDGLSNKALAVLLTMLDETAAANLRSTLNERRSGMITEELELINSLPDAKKLKEQKIYKGQVVSLLKKMKSDGVLVMTASATEPDALKMAS
jgi:flagellar motility protein MotE (MotC chaperone)